MDKINQRIATELGVASGQVAAAVELLGEGSTVPFIARYRKEKTGGLDDTQLRKLENRLGYLRDLEDRRATVLKTVCPRFFPKARLLLANKIVSLDEQVARRSSHRSSCYAP
jgi:transcriptional accessory protein Tex/SPT6